MLTEVAYVTIALFLAGLIFAAGKLTARLESLESWRIEMKHTIDEVFNLLRRVERKLPGVPPADET